MPRQLCHRMLFTMKAGSYWFDIFNDYAATSVPAAHRVLVETARVLPVRAEQVQLRGKCTHEGHHSQHLSPRVVSAIPEKPLQSTVGQTLSG